MGLKMYKRCQWWYGRWVYKGQTHRVNLGIEIKGKRPHSLEEQGDRAFERSRFKAEQKLDELKMACAKRVYAGELVQQLHKIRTGDRISTVKLADLPATWEGLDRRRAVSPRYLAQTKSHVTRFVKFIAARYPAAEEMMDVTDAMAEAFMRHEDRRGISPQTYNDILGLLRGAFNRLKKKASLYQNPFDDILRKVEQPVFRKPFTPEDIRAILDACKDDDFIRPVIIIAICTAMRRGDCCKLSWESIDMKRRLIQVATSKTGEPISVPIFKLLREELLKLGPRRSGPVLPEQLRMYETNPDGITTRVKVVLGRAGFCDANGKRHGYKQWLVPRHLTKQEVDAICNLVASAPSLEKSPKKKSRLLGVLREYLQGKSLPEIHLNSGLSKGTVSNYLNEAETVLGRPLVRGKARQANPEPAHVSNLDRENGIRAASVRDFHSFRTTWITLALMARIPMELVRMVTGHRTVEVVLKHYFHPDGDAIRRTFEQAMPDVITGGSSQKPPEAIIREIAENTTPATAVHDMARIREVLRGQSLLLPPSTRLANTA